MARLGILLLGPPSEFLLDVFLQGLRALGYVEGRNISIEQRLLSWSDLLPNFRAGDTNRPGGPAGHQGHSHRRGDGR